MVSKLRGPKVDPLFCWMSYLGDWWIWRSRCNERNSAGSGIIGHHRFPDIGLHVRDVPQVSDGANALEERAALYEARFGIVNEQGFVHIVGQFLFGRGRAVGQHTAGGGVLLGPCDGCHCKLEIWKRIKKCLKNGTTICHSWGRFHNMFYTLHRLFALYAKLYATKKLLKSWASTRKLGVGRKSVYEIDPRSHPLNAGIVKGKRGAPCA